MGLIDKSETRENGSGNHGVGIHGSRALIFHALMLENASLHCKAYFDARTKNLISMKTPPLASRPEKKLRLECNIAKNP
jgi:hypothetical protein